MRGTRELLDVLSGGLEREDPEAQSAKAKGRRGASKQCRR
jgi:hypothetical protein